MSITAKPANEIEFTMADRDGTGEVRTNLAAYYKNAYGKDLRYPRLPYVARACWTWEWKLNCFFSQMRRLRQEELCAHGVCRLGAVQLAPPE